MQGKIFFLVNWAFNFNRETRENFMLTNNKLGKICIDSIYIFGNRNETLPNFLKFMFYFLSFLSFVYAIIEWNYWINKKCSNYFLDSCSSILDSQSATFFFNPIYNLVEHLLHQYAFVSRWRFFTIFFPSSETSFFGCIAFFLKLAFLFFSYLILCFFDSSYNETSHESSIYNFFWGG